MGLGSFKRKQNLKRHANSKEHKVAQRAWEQQKLAPGIETINNTLESATLASTPAASAKDKAASTKSLFPTTAHRAVVATRALLDCEGMVSMLEACVRRACLSPAGEVDTTLPQHVREQTRVWCSDGADLNVPLAASAFFPGLVFHA